MKFPTIIKDSEMEKIFRVFEKFKYSIKGILTSNAGIYLDILEVQTMK